jgi:hypothetical protein
MREGWSVKKGSDSPLRGRRRNPTIVVKPELLTRRRAALRPFAVSAPDPRGEMFCLRSLICPKRLATTFPEISGWIHGLQESLYSQKGKRSLLQSKHRRIAATILRLSRYAVRQGRDDVTDPSKGIMAQSRLFPPPLPSRGIGLRTLVFIDEFPSDLTENGLLEFTHRLLRRRTFRVIPSGFLSPSCCLRASRSYGQSALRDQPRSGCTLRFPRRSLLHKC